MSDPKKKPSKATPKSTPKKASKKTPKDFLTELAGDPVLLAKFIHNADALLAESGISEDEWVHIKNAVAHDVHKKLTSTPDAYALML